MPLGYDPDHRVYTVQNAFPYPQDYTLQKAKDFFSKLFKEFCFLGNERSIFESIVLASGLTLYCAQLLPSNSIRPNFLIDANSEGSGKTLLCKIPIIAIAGQAPASTVPEDENEMRKLIAAAALSGSAVLFLDNIKKHLSSSSLESLTTSPWIEFRILGHSKLERAEHGLTVFMTANRGTLSPDLGRRTLIVELFLNEAQPEQRLINHPLDDTGIIKLRAKILASFWALVHHWAQNACPKPQQPNQSFVAWNNVVGAILEAAGYPSPSQSYTIKPSSGDLTSAHMQYLVEKMIEGSGYRVSELVDLSREYRLFEWIVGQDGDPDLEPANRSRFGLLLKRFENRIFRFANPNSQQLQILQFGLLTLTQRKVYGVNPPPQQTYQP